jgi:hypothetical protein
MSGGIQKNIHQQFTEDLIFHRAARLKERQQSINQGDSL